MFKVVYVWITADITNSADAESRIVDASLVNIKYKNYNQTEKTVDLTSKGNPEGDMRIFKAQSFVKVSTENNGTEAHYYRNPAILNIGANTVLAFYEDRYDNVNGLGKDYDGSEYGHCMDVVVCKSADNGKTWGTPVKVGTGTEGTDATEPIGYAGPAVVYNGSKIICLMAKGSNSYDKGLTTVAMRTATITDGNVTWSGEAPTDITIDWNNLSPTSFYVTPGKGVAYSDGHVAFVINAKVGGRLQEYLFYSTNADFTTWSVDPTPLSGKGKESKLEMDNNNSLMVMGKTPISKECNNDMLYFKRSNEGNDQFDAILQTAIWKYESQRLKDLRLYACFDQQRKTWKQLFYVQPANAATNSMQKLSSSDANGFNGDLAICFEDGSIGNDEKDGCYALTYIVIGKEMIQQQSADVHTATIVTRQSKNGSEPNISNGSGWLKSVTTTPNSGYADIEISARYNAFNRAWVGSGDSRYRYLCIQPSAAGATDVITLKAPEGYVIESYSISGFYYNSSETYSLVDGNNSNNTASINLAAGTYTGDGPTVLTVNNIKSPTATFSLTNNNSSKSSYALINYFTVTLARQEYSTALHPVNGKSYATLYFPHDLTFVDSNTKAYYITEVTDGKAVLTETGSEGHDIPQHTAVVLINKKGDNSVLFTYTEDLAPIVSEDDNMLKGNLEENWTLDMKNNPCLFSLGKRSVNSGAYVAGFYNTGKEQQLAPYRAYLDTSVPSDAPSRGFDLPFDEDILGIADASTEAPTATVETPWYTLDGRLVNGTPHVRGIYVKNGKKIVVK